MVVELSLGGYRMQEYSLNAKSLTHFIKEDYLFSECAKMTKEPYFVDTLVRIKYNKTLKVQSLCLHKSMQFLMRVSWH